MVSDPQWFQPDWVQASDTIASTTSSPPITLICGPKNSGKTTFSRYLLKTLLERYNKVAYLDTDVGQSEFTPPGCLSLFVFERSTEFLNSLVEKPEWYEKSLVRRPKRFIYFGDTSSKRDPKTYLNNIFSLYSYFQTQYYMSDESEKLPLVIDTPGWVKGLGFNILVELLRYISPSHVVKIQTSFANKNLPTGEFWLDAQHEGLVNLIELNPVNGPSNESVLIKKDAHFMRDKKIFAYFKQCFPKDSNITSIKELAYGLISHPPYEVPISSIKVTHLHCQVPSSEIFRSLNATIVGLAVSSIKSTESGPCSPWCIGLGIVRGIDILKGLFYILTPVPQRNLEKVDLFLQGFIQIPASLLQKCGSPYISETVLPSKPKVLFS